MDGWYLPNAYRRRIILESFPKTSTRKTILDAGCSIGYMYLKLVNRGYEVLGVDANDDFKFTSESLPSEYASRLSYVQGDLENLSLRDSLFDGIICVDVLEHIHDDVSVVTSFYQALKSGGVLVLHVPSIDGMKEFVGARDLEVRKGKEDLRAHFRDGYEVEQAVTLLMQAGFSEIVTFHTFTRATQLSYLLDGHRFRQIVFFLPFRIAMRLQSYLKDSRPYARSDFQGIMIRAKKTTRVDSTK